MNFFGQWTKYAEFFSYLYAFPGYTKYAFFLKINQPLISPLRLAQKWSAQQIVEFPTSHTCISFVTQHVLCVPVIRNYNISGQMHVLCIRNVVTYAGTVVVLQVL